jgi:hypothetical protein
VVLPVLLRFLTQVNIVAQPAVIVSNDRGVTWNYKLTSTTPTMPAGVAPSAVLGAASCNGSLCIVSGITSLNQPLVALSRDNGNTWSYVVTPSTPTVPPGLIFSSLLNDTVGSSTLMPESLRFMVDSNLH